MEQRWQLRAAPLFVIMIACISCLPCSGAKKPERGEPRLLQRYRDRVPLGMQTFLFTAEGDSKVFYLLASAQDRGFAGDSVWQLGDQHILKDAQGERVKSYPRQLRFRVSVCEKDGLLPGDAPLPLETHAGTFDALITRLKFEVHVFHELQKRTLRPIMVKQVGVPPDVPSNRRIYEVTFDMGNVPISDHIVMQVFADQGERLAKFNLDLF